MTTTEMKRKVLAIPAAAASLMMLLAACSADADAPGAMAASPVITLTTNGIQATTRAVTADALQNDGNFLTDEKIDIFFEDAHTGAETKTSYTLPLTYTADGSGNLTYPTVQFWPRNNHPLSVYGVYPAGLVSDYSDALSGTQTYSFTVASNQSAFSKPLPVKEDRPDGTSDEDWAAYEAQYAADCDAARGYSGSDLILGVPEFANPLTQTETSGPVALTFTHMLSKVIVNIQKTDATEYSDGQLEAAKVTILNTKPTTTFNVKTQALTAASGTATDIIARETETEMDYSDPDNPVDNTLYTGKSVAAIIVPQEVAATTQFIKIEVGSDVFIYSLATATTFASARVYTYNVKVHKASISVTSTITPWTAEAAVNGKGYLQ
jgi:hypothetical protein